MVIFYLMSIPQAPSYCCCCCCSYYCCCCCCCQAGELVRGGFDKVILGTGVTPRSLQLPDGGADHPKVLAYADVLRGDVTVGDRVAVVGAGGIGFDVAEFLTHAKGVRWFDCWIVRIYFLFFDAHRPTD